MSRVIDTVDLTMYGCPMHLIKARDALRSIKLQQTVVLIVNQGSATRDIVMNLEKDGQLCELASQDNLTTTIKVTKQQ